MGNQSRFSVVPTINAPRSNFKTPYRHITTCNENELVPVFTHEINPGDTIKMDMSVFGRMNTQIVPAMDNINQDIHFFFVPNRLVWDNWEKFMGAQENPSDSIDYLIPTINVTSTDWLEDSIFDHFGIPKPANGSIDVSALPFRALALIFNEWYRDQNFQDSIVIEKGDTGAFDTSTFPNYPYNLPRNKRHDYFTSALPFAQKGSPVSISLTGNAPIGSSASSGEPLAILRDDDNKHALIGTAGITAAMGSATGTQPSPGILTARLDDVTAITINKLRQAFQLQKFLERDARSGTRYIEVIKSHFNVDNPDYRLQRPEYLGGQHNGVNVSTVPQTTPDFTGSETPQGNLAAFATVSGSGHCFNKSFTEHGFIIGLMNFTADVTYQQGLERFWSRQTRVDHYFPEFAHLGEQTILNKEIFVTGDETDDEVFGYQERYAELRYKPDMITGKLRSTDPQSLDVWHYAEEFTALPVLGADFIRQASPIKRNVVNIDEPTFKVDIKFNLDQTKILPMFGTPGFVDHF
ncbi:MAG: major capsid protein [Microviridae sp.]|nr:MAG: major capsid protein [Microviridae sp.]